MPSVFEGVQWTKKHAEGSSDDGADDWKELHSILLEEDDQEKEVTVHVTFTRIRRKTRRGRYELHKRVDKIRMNWIGQRLVGRADAKKTFVGRGGGGGDPALLQESRASVYPPGAI